MFIQLVSVACFGLGISLIVFRFLAGIRFSRTSRLSYTHLWKVQSAWDRFWERWKEKEEASNQKTADKLKLAGHPFGLDVFRYNLIKLSLLLFVVLVFLVQLPVYRNVLEIPFFTYFLFMAISWFGPDLIITLLASRRKTRLMIEISKFSHRISLCLTDKSELRETLLRASRTLPTLKPYINELSTNWNTGQEAAIYRFGQQVGITEVYPLVNTLVATTKVDSAEVVQMLEKQMEEIDKTLEHEILRKIENAPLYIIFLIMIPFTVVFVLLIYPWVRYMTELLSTSL